MKITRKKLLNLIKEALNAEDLLNQQGEWRVMSDADARQRYEDYVLSQGDYIDGGLLDPENESLYDSFIEWMKLHSNEFRDELSKLERGEDPMIALAAQKSKGDNDPDTNDDGMLSVDELEKMTQDIAADLREGSVKITRRKLRRIIREELNWGILSEQVAHVPETVNALRSIMGPGTGNSYPRGSHKADDIMRAWTQILGWFKRYGDSETRRESVRKVCTRLIAPASGGRIQRQSGAGYIDHQGLDPTESCTDDRRDRSDGDGPGIEWDDCLPCEQSAGVAEGLGPITSLSEEKAVLMKVFRYVACAAGIEFILDRQDDLNPMLRQFREMLREYERAIKTKFSDPENR